MARGVRGGSKSARESQRKLRDRKQRKKWAKELAGLESGKKKAGLLGLDITGQNTKRRIKKIKEKLNIPKKMPETTKPDGSKLEPTTSGSKESQAKAQQKVIDSKEYKAGTEKLKNEYKPGDLSKNPKKAYFSPSLGRNVTGAGIKAKAAADRKEMLENQRKKKTQKKDGTPKSSEKSSKKKSESKGSTVHTRHYKTGKTLGVMTRAQRRKYDAEAKAAGGKSYEERVAAHEKESGHGKSHKRETLYNISQRKKKKKNLKATKKEN
jgi:hypothetical protein